jgi:hypothetical protein
MHIDSYRFGQIRIDGTDYANDVLVLRDRVLSPWWRQAGGHLYAPEDLGPVVDLAPEVVCLGTGYFGRVTVHEATLDAFTAAGSRPLVGRTGRMVEEYNRLVEEGCDVAAALHLTC